MNEIKHIHLGRTSFTMSAEVYKVMRDYLDDIKAKAGKQGGEIVEEVEARMAELLRERGFDEKKVILEQDFTYLREQLGEPSDFAEDTDETKAAAAESEPAQKRLYRDTATGWLGGVASGLAGYTGLPVWFIRLAFIVLTFVWGASILMYILLWLMLPDAKTPSDRLRMQGKPVNVETLKEFVEKSGMSDNAREIGNRAAEAGTRLGRLAAGVGKVVLAVAGVWLLLVSICAVIGLLAGGSYVLFHPEGLFAGVTLFPVGSAETSLLIIAVLTLVLLAILLGIVGMSLVKRRWPLPIWLSACLIILLIAGAVVSAVGGAAIAPKIRDRYNAARVEVTRNVPEFKTIDGSNLDNVDISFVQSPSFAVTFIAYGAINQNALKASVSGGELHISMNNYRRSPSCQSLCLPLGQLQVIVSSPTAITPPDWFATPEVKPFPVPHRYYVAPPQPLPPNGNW